MKFSNLFWSSMALITLIFLAYTTNYSTKSTDSQVNLQQSYTEFLKQHPTLETSLEEALKKISGDASKENIEIRPLASNGAVSQLYSIHLKGQKYVLRFFNPRSSVEAKTEEIKVHEFAASLGIAPPILFVDTDCQYLIMPDLEAHCLTKQDLLNPKVLESLGSYLGKLHHYQGDFKRELPQALRVKKHYDRIQRLQIALPSAYSSLYQSYQHETLELDCEPKVLCHGDLNPGNILVNKEGKVFIIDWTTASWDTPYADLGYLSLLNGFSQEQSLVFLKAYFGGVLPAESLAKLGEAQKRVCFVTATVYFGYSESDQEKEAPLASRVKRLDDWLASADLILGTNYIAKEETISLKGPTDPIKLYALGFLKNYMLPGQE